MTIPSLSIVVRTCGVKKTVLGYSDKCPKYYMPSTHAEVSAINKIIRWRNLPKSVDLFVVKINSSGNFVNSMPCFHCIKYILRKLNRVNTKNIYYSTNDGSIERLKVNDIQRQTLKQTFKETSGTRRKSHKKTMRTIKQ